MAARDPDDWQGEWYTNVGRKRGEERREEERPGQERRAGQDRPRQDWTEDERRRDYRREVGARIACVRHSSISSRLDQ